MICQFKAPKVTNLILPLHFHAPLHRGASLTEFGLSVLRIVTAPYRMLVTLLLSHYTAVGSSPTTLTESFLRRDRTCNRIPKWQMYAFVHRFLRNSPTLYAEKSNLLTRNRYLVSLTLSDTSLRISPGHELMGLRKAVEAQVG